MEKKDLISEKFFEESKYLLWWLLQHKFSSVWWKAWKYLE